MIHCFEYHACILLSCLPLGYPLAAYSKMHIFHLTLGLIRLCTKVCTVLLHHMYSKILKPLHHMIVLWYGQSAACWSLHCHLCSNNSPIWQFSTTNGGLYISCPTHTCNISIALYICGHKYRQFHSHEINNMVKTSFS